MTTQDLPAPQAPQPPPPLAPPEYAEQHGDQGPARGQAPRTDSEKSSSVGLFFLLALIVWLFFGAGWGALLTLVGFVVLIFFHELGHFVMAKRAGMKVTQFFLGFGPKIWSFTRGETEYGVKAIPAGAYVKVIGMNNLEEVPAEDEAKTYRQGRYRDRMGVVLGGPLMNLFLGFVGLVLLYSTFGFVGIDSLVRGPEAVVGEVVAIDDLDQPTAAGAIGLQAGDRIIGVNDLDDAAWFDVVDLLRTLDAGDQVEVTFERGDETLTGVGELGTRVNETTGTEHGMLGVRVSEEAYDPQVERLGLIDAVGTSVGDYGTIVKESLIGVSTLVRPSTWTNLLGLNASDPAPAASGSTSSSSTSSSSGGDGSEQQFMGPIGIISSGAGASLEALLFLWVLINVFVGLFNLVPLLPFDGGHAVLATYERIRSIGGKRHFADVGRLMPFVYPVVAAFVVLGLAVAFRDIERILG